MKYFQRFRSKKTFFDLGLGSLKMFSEAHLKKKDLLTTNSTFFGLNIAYTYKKNSKEQSLNMNRSEFNNPP